MRRCPCGHAQDQSRRPTKLTPEVQERIVKTLSAGSYATVAARCAGIDSSTYYRWIERGDPGGTAKRDAPYRDFRAAVEQAKKDGRPWQVFRPKDPSKPADYFARNSAIVAEADHMIAFWDGRSSGTRDDRNRIGTGRASGSGITRTVTSFSCG